MSDGRPGFKMPKLMDRVYADNCGPERTVLIAVVFHGEMYWLLRNEPFVPPGDQLFKTADCNDNSFPPDDTDPYAYVRQNGMVKLAGCEVVLGHSDEFRFFGQRWHQFLTRC